MLVALLAVLRYHPDNGPALKMLDEYRTATPPAVVVVEEGDSLASIARSQYGNPEFGALIAHFNDLKTETVLQPGLRLQIPAIQSTPHYGTPSDRPRVSQGYRLADKGRFTEALAVAEKILEPGLLGP